MKTFDITTPSGLLLKLRYDITRLKNSKGSPDLRYAALDCAITAWHLSDWLLASVSDQRYQELTGVKRDARGFMEGFIARNEQRLPDIRTCQLIANTGKHLVLTKHDDATIEARTTVRFTPPFDAADPSSWANVKVQEVAYISRGAGTQNAIEFFLNVERHWRHVLVDEGLLSSNLRDRSIEDDPMLGYSTDE